MALNKIDVLTKECLAAIFTKSFNILRNLPDSSVFSPNGDQALSFWHFKLIANAIY